jgi:HprK-related kinase A
VVLRTGPFALHLRTPHRDLSHAVHFLYGDFVLDEHARFADFHVEIRPPSGLRRWFRRQTLFHRDGEPLFYPYPGRLTVPLFEWGLNWCVAMTAHQYLMLHAAVLERDGLAVLLPAKPGTGKSTLCAALAHRGWRLLSDEMALVRPADGLLDPLPRPIGLKNESIPVLRAFAPDAALGPVWPDTKKGTVAHVRPPRDSVARDRETARPAWIVFPAWRHGAAAAFAPHDKAEAFLRVADNSMNYPATGAAGFEVLGRLVDRCDCLEFEYGRLEEAVEAFAALEPPRDA